MNHQQKCTLIRVSCILANISAVLCLLCGLFFTFSANNVLIIFQEMLNETTDPMELEVINYFISNFDLLIIYSQICLYVNAAVTFICSLYLMNYIKKSEAEFYDKMSWFYATSIILMLICGTVVFILMLIALCSPRPKKLVHNNIEIEQEIIRLKQRLAEGKITQEEYNKKIIEIIK